jgi:hypothetical protein
MDWATVALAIGPATVTGAVSYGVGLLQRDSAVRQANIRIEELRIQHAEAERSHRQGTYHRFAMVMGKGDAMMSGLAPYSRELLERWIAEWQELAVGISVFAPDEVISAQRAVGKIMGEVMDEAAKRNIEGPEPRPAYHAAFRELYRTRRRDLDPPRTALMAAMRDDVRLLAEEGRTGTRAD